MAKLFLLGLGSTAVIGGGIGTGVYFGVDFGNRSQDQKGKGEKPGAKLESPTDQEASASNNESRKSEQQEIP